jgi:hypothetical protein
MAADALEHLVLRSLHFAGTAICRLRHDVEHVPDARDLSRLSTPMALDLMPAMRGLVASRGLVRGRGPSRHTFAAFAFFVTSW